MASGHGPRPWPMAMASGHGHKLFWRVHPRGNPISKIYLFWGTCLFYKYILVYFSEFFGTPWNSLVCGPVHAAAPKNLLPPRASRSHQVDNDSRLNAYCHLPHFQATCCPRRMLPRLRRCARATYEHGLPLLLRFAIMEAVFKVQSCSIVLT